MLCSTKNLNAIRNREMVSGMYAKMDAMAHVSCLLFMLNSVLNRTYIPAQNLNNNRQTVRARAFALLRRIISDRFFNQSGPECISGTFGLGSDFVRA